MSSEWSNGRNVGVAISHDENGSEWRIATGDWSNEGCLLERLSAATKTATTEDKNGGQVGSRQIGRSENGSKERMANSRGRPLCLPCSRGRPLCLPCSRGERRFALNSHDKNGSQWRLVKRKLTVRVAISHDRRRQPRQKRRTGRQSANRQVGRWQAVSGWAVRGRRGEVLPLGARCRAKFAG